MIVGGVSIGFERSRSLSHKSPNTVNPGVPKELQNSVLYLKLYSKYSYIVTPPDISSTLHLTQNSVLKNESHPRLVLNNPDLISEQSITLLKN